MYPTRRLWAGVTLIVALCVFAVVLERPLLLAGAILIGAWILAHQVAFVTELERVHETLTVEQDVDRREAPTGGTTVATLSARLDRPSKLALSLESGVPTAATADGPLELTLEPGTSDASEAVSITWPVAGRHRFEHATVTVSGPLFEETLPVADTPTVTVEPRQPRRVHVGAGGDRIAAVHGVHTGAQSGPGIEPAGLREYTSGDTAERVDWKATARLGTTYVREHETETSQRTLLLVDERSSLALGTPSETKLDYLREVALAMAATAHEQDDPIGLLTVDEEGGSYLDPTSAAGGYEAVRRRLLDVEATPENGVSAGTRTGATRGDSGVALTGSVVRERRTTLQDVGSDDDPFSENLYPFYADRTTTGDRLARTLPEAVRTALARSTRELLLVVCTDDTNPGELHELATVARSRGHELVLLLAPTVLYEPGGLTDVDRAYTRYLEFEELRRDLSRPAGVTAFEVGPGDRLASVLAAGQTRTRGGSR